METRSIISGRVGHPRGRKPKLGEPGRRCAEPGCDTRLTRYNPKDRCFAHQPCTRPRLRGLRPRSERQG